MLAARERLRICPRASDASRDPGDGSRDLGSRPEAVRPAHCALLQRLALSLSILYPARVQEAARSCAVVRPLTSTSCVRLGMGEVGRDRWTLSLQFIFLPAVGHELMVVNPMGIIVTYLRGDRGLVTGR